MHNEVSGILILDEGNTPLLASGVAGVKLVSTSLARRWARRVMEPVPRMFIVDDVAQPLSVLCFETQGAGCFLIFPSDAGHDLLEFFATVEFAPDIVRHLITSPYEAMTVVDRKGIVRYLSPVHEKFFGLAHGSAVGQHVTRVIENTHLHEVAASGKPEIGHLQEMNGVSRVVTRTPIVDQHGRTAGAIGRVMFKGPDAIAKLSEQVSQLKKQLVFYERELSGLQNRAWGLDQIVGTSEAVKRLKADIVKVASLDVPVLLVGESGTGKELVAHAIQSLSPRSGQAMVLVNSAALPAHLVEAELFGYEAGAFTGADRKGRAGKFEVADKGTLFLDEIGDMPVDMQAKLLRVLQDGTFERVGGNQPRRSDFRLISATNRDFKSMIAQNTFRLDLFYRISTVTLRLPPLRERLGDIALLADTVLADFAARHRQKRKTLAPGAVAWLQAQARPGNIRQLRHTVERAAIFSETDVVTAQSVASAYDDGTAQPPTSAAAESASLQVAAHDNAAARPPQQDMKGARSKIEGDLIADAMRRFDGNKKKVAETLNISRSYLYKKLAALHIK